MLFTCCGICIGSHRRRRYPVGECIWIWDRGPTRGTSFEGTFVYWKEEEEDDIELSITVQEFFEVWVVVTWLNELTRKCNNTTNNNNTQIKRHRHEPCKFSLALSHPIVPSFHPTGEEKRRGRGTLMTTTKLIPPLSTVYCTVLTQRTHTHTKSLENLL